MKGLWSFLVVFLLVLAVFRMVNGAPFVGVSEILIKLETVDFDISPLVALKNYFFVDEPDSSTYMVFIPSMDIPSFEELFDEYGNYIGIQDKSDNFFDNILHKFEELYEFFYLILRDIPRFLKIVVDVVAMPFKMLFQVFDVVLWMFGFTA